MGSEGLSLCQDAVANIAQAVWRHHVYGRAEQILKVQLEPDEVEQGSARVELDQKVDVAFIAIVATNY